MVAGRSGRPLEMLLDNGRQRGREGLVTHICFQRYLPNGNFIPTHTYNGTARLNLDTQYASP